MRTSRAGVGVWGILRHQHLRLSRNGAITTAAASADAVICAWGTHGAHMKRGASVEHMLRANGHTLFHLGLSQAGHPKHPLYISYTQQLIEWA